MPFTIRVEMHEASAAVYAALHVEMKAFGSTRFIKAVSGFWYELPPAEYRYEGFASGESVLEWAKSAAMRAGDLQSVLVTENGGAGQVWFWNLRTLGVLESLTAILESGPVNALSL